MAQLSFDGIQPVRFGGRDCTPKLNTELRLRLQGLKFSTDADAEKANKILAECFPDDQEYVLAFLSDQMTPFEKQQLSAYLISGPSMIRILDEKIAEAMGSVKVELGNE